MALTHFEVRSREPFGEGVSFGTTGTYEQIDGIAHFAVAPDNPANRRIIDLHLAPRDAAGLVRFEADLSIVMPSSKNAGNGRAFVELPNRGRRRLVQTLNLAPQDSPVARVVHPGDGYLFEQGFVVASIGWQWDVNRGENMMGLDAPLAQHDGKSVTGQNMIEIRPGRPTDTWLLADRIHKPLSADVEKHAEAKLFVRDFEDGDDELIPNNRWQFACKNADGVLVDDENHIHLSDGFESGRIYQLVYTAKVAPVAGVGLIAFRDVAEFLRTARADNPTDADFRALYAWGVSQTGRMQRHFLHLGLNRCENGEVAYDGMLVHVAGARRGSFNHRFAQPSNQTTPLWGHAFPYADLPIEDPLTGSKKGLLDAADADNSIPKIIYTDTAAEYWRGDAALAHIDTRGEQDLPEHPNTRRYLFSGTQHVAGYPGQSRENEAVNIITRYPTNIVDYRPLLRAAVHNLDRWVTMGISPPPSRHPRLANGTAVTRDRILHWFDSLPGFAIPDANRLPFVRTVDMGAEESVGVANYPAEEGEFYPALVSAIDDDGNELAGIRLPDIEVPIGTHAGWNPRDPSIGSAEQIVPMSGLTLPFCVTDTERAASNDPRPALMERYAGIDDYAAKVRIVAVKLAGAGYLLDRDVDAVCAAALARYEYVLSSSTQA